MLDVALFHLEQIEPACCTIVVDSPSLFLWQADHRVRRDQNCFRAAHQK